MSAKLSNIITQAKVISTNMKQSSQSGKKKAEKENLLMKSLIHNIGFSMNQIFQKSFNDLMMAELLKQ